MCGHSLGAINQLQMPVQHSSLDIPMACHVHVEHGIYLYECKLAYLPKQSHLPLGGCHGASGLLNPSAQIVSVMKMSLCYSSHGSQLLVSLCKGQRGK